MGTWLPAKYNLLSFLVPALLYPTAGLLVGEPFTDPTIVDLVALPGVIVLFSNIGHYVRSRRDESGVVDERDVRNIDLALAEREPCFSSRSSRFTSDTRERAGRLRPKSIISRWSA